MSIHITREQVEAMVPLFAEHNADAVLITSTGNRSDVFVALLDDQGTNLASVAIDTLGDVGEGDE